MPFHFRSKQFLRIVSPALVVLTVAFSSRDVCAGTIYIFSGTRDFDDASHENLELEIKDGKAVGELRPSPGYKGPTVKVDGSNSTEGTLDLTFHFPSGVRRVQLKKSVEGRRLTWESQEKDNTVSFYRNLDAPFSKAALTLTPSSCGPHYEDLAVRFAPNATEAGLADFFSKNAELRKAPVTVHRKVKKKKKGEIVEDEKPVVTSLEKGLAILYLSCTRFRGHQVRCFMEPEVCDGETEVYARVSIGVQI